MYAVIMAGGGGTRLWPKSRLKKPKQLQALISEESMLKNTISRLLPILPKEKIYIATNTAQIKAIKNEINGRINFIQEPFMRNTGPCMGLAALMMKEQNEPTAFLPSDHYISDEKEFRRVLKKGAEVAKMDYLVTLGIRPTDPDTGLGYIKIKSKIEEQRAKTDYPVYQVEKFIEKPDLETAKKFQKNGGYLWNAGIFIAKPKIILSLFKKHAPIIYERLMNIAKNPKSLKREYEKMPNISFDYAIAEKAKKVAVIPSEFGWSDIGNWAKLLEKLSQASEENVVIGCEHYGIDTKGCLIHGTERLVATIGLNDIIVVDTPDAVLVCRKDRAQEVKKIVERLQKDKKEHYL